MLNRAKMVSWNEVIECYKELQKDGLSLLIRGFTERDRHRYMILVAPQIEMAVDIDTTLSIPHRGGLKAILDEKKV